MPTLTQINFVNWTDPDRSMRHADFDADQFREHPRCLVLPGDGGRRGSPGTFPVTVEAAWLATLEDLRAGLLPATMRSPSDNRADDGNLSGSRWIRDVARPLVRRFGHYRGRRWRRKPFPPRNCERGRSDPDGLPSDARQSELVLGGATRTMPNTTPVLMAH